ncbi:MAG: flagellar filament capping protein FliD, partial [Planctomycetes bacterium]|nr:flagellar filament capping protein FliD [Planctomycetota bacterium]
ADALTAAVASDGNPAVGNYLFTPVQTAAAQQFLSQSFTSGQPVGAGVFTFRTGGFVDQGISLDELNGGAGVSRGKIRVTDRSGASAVIDLSFARTIDDVLRAISEDTTINVTAVAAGDAIKLLDNTGGSGNLSVQNVSNGLTATNLGLDGINTASATATGADVFTLHAQTRLSLLNDGTGVRLLGGVGDLEIALADGSTVTVDLGDADTLGDVVQAINAASPTKVSVAIAADGNRLEATDLTSGSGTFAVSSVGSGTAAENLGLVTTASGDTISGRRLVGGLRDTLVSSLQGGQGLGTLGEIDITNRNNVSSTVDLSGAETLGQIIDAFNNQAIGVTAQVNSARNGILLTDTTGATASNLILADGDANNSATSLGLAANVAATTVNGGGLDRHTISTATLLSSLKGGAGVAVDDIKITDSAGNFGVVDLDQTNNVATTIGDVIDRINAITTVGVVAQINDTGDGIVLLDTAGSTGKLTVSEVGNGTAAKDLRLLGTSKTVDIGGTPTEVIDGTATVTVTIGEDDTLADLVATINGLGQGVTAGVLNDGTGQRLSLSVNQSGAENALLVDTSQSTLALQQITRAQDAFLLYGAGTVPGAGVLLSSSTNQFKNVINGVNLTVKDGTLEPVTVSVTASDSAVVDAVKGFVDAFNSIRDSLDEMTVFNEEDLSTGILFGTREALRVESDLTRLLTSRFFGVGTFESLEAVGISLDAKGQMVLDQEKLTTAFADKPEALKQLFADEDLGVSTKFNAIIEQLAGENGSLLATRWETLSQSIDTNYNRLTFMDERLVRERDRLLLEFYQLETLIAEMQRGLSALSSLNIIPPLTSGAFS